jgi:phosphoinositide-3-kinase regulatory subunit 4
LQASRVLAAEAAAAAAASAAAAAASVRGGGGGGGGAALATRPPLTNPGIAAALASELPTHAADAARARAAAPWRPRGVPLAHLAEHSRAVTALAVARGGRFFVSASADGTARVWDAAGLERDVSQRSRGVYGGQAAGGGRLTCAATCADGDTVATGCSDGSIHVGRASYARGGGGAPVGRPAGGGGGSGAAPERVSGLTPVTALAPPASSADHEGPILALHDWGRLLLYSTLRGGVRAWDVRADPRGAHAAAWALPADPREGSVCVVLGGGAGGDADAASSPADAWLLAATSRGVVSLWDARLALRAHAWRLPGGACVLAAAAATAPHARLGVRSGPPPAGPLIWLAAAGEAGLWDVAAGACRAVFRVLPDTAGASARPAMLAEPPAAPPVPVPGDLDPAATTAAPSGMRALLSTGAGPLLTGSADGCVRLWDGAAPEESYIVAGDPNAANEEAGSGGSGGGGSCGAGVSGRALLAPSARARMYARRTVDGVTTVDEAPCAAAALAPPMPAVAGPGLVEPSSARALAHRDAVTALASLDGVSGVRLLLSASRDGVVKAWR